MTLVISAVMLPQERLNRLQISGVLLGVLGVLLVVGPWQLIGDPAFLSSIPAQLACLAATACYGVGLSYLRRFVSGTHNYDATTIAAVQIVLAFALACVLAPFSMLNPVQLNCR
ncbi:drug/metabolite transporter (DMT)-like permease [Psychromicrobium silvestre]|uniref:Drug/metabolite transporter (DMT)-like permease n=1 Tax=Psychromicrobium silvestre TaxID=1645614 RepID=A0A7Y9S8I6_9MICC|nr:hypothetical protein [Psychromicrobium silvestre]NYE95392.1 drug/metabolite transporter (DMT)-like permease [Psychromicrobium silvestre]